MTDLFGRQVILVLDSDEYSDFRVDFTVTKTAGSAANEAEISIYNLRFDDGALERAQRRDTIVRLFAGYTSPGLIFQGNPIRNGVEFSRDGADTILKISAKDGYRQYKDTVINTSFSTGTSFKDVIDELVLAAGLARGSIIVPEDRTLTQGVVLTGDVETIFRRMSDTLGADISIQDGALSVLPRNEANPNLAPFYNSETGTLLSCSNTDYGVELSVLLDNTLNPGDRFRVQHREVEGNFRARKVEYVGSQWSDEFVCNIEGTPYPPPPRPVAPALLALGERLDDEFAQDQLNPYTRLADDWFKSKQGTP